MNIDKIYDTGRVRRFHTIADYTGTPLQTVAEHAWGVALLCMEICRRVHMDVSPTLLRAALLHDAEEQYTGDLPAPVKWRFPELASAMRVVEVTVRDELGVDYDVDLTPAEKAILKWADALELYLYCKRRVAAGVAAYREPMDNIVSYMRMNLPPIVGASELLQELRATA